MKTLFEAEKVDGIKHPKYEVEAVCSNCQDPISAHEEETGVCTNCGQPWDPKVSVSIWVTSVPAAGAKVWGT